VLHRRHGDGALDAQGATTGGAECGCALMCAIALYVSRNG
jgi:hypothetical protein